MVGAEDVNADATGAEIFGVKAVVSKVRGMEVVGATTGGSKVIGVNAVSTKVQRLWAL